MADPILIDANVLKDISRGSAPAADGLRNYLRRGTEVYIAHAAYDELVTRAPNEQFRAHYRQMLNDLGIQKAPTTGFESRVNLYRDNITHQPRQNQPGSFRDYRNDNPGDMFVAAQARAIGALLWTSDRKMRSRAPEFGVRLAPECALGGQSGTEDPNRARRLLNLQPITVTANGTVIKTRPGSGSGGHGRGGGQTGGGAAPPPAAPPTTGGGGGTKAKLRRTTTARVGAPDMRPVITGGPSQRGTAKGRGIELAFRGVNFVLNWLNDREQARRAQKELDRIQARITSRAATMGVLLVFKYKQRELKGTENDSLIRPGPVFTGLEFYLGQTPDEAAEQRRRTPTISDANRSQTVWIPPKRPAGAARLTAPFARLQLATFADGRTKVQRVQWNGTLGFDDEGEQELSVQGIEPLFHVLQPPNQITFSTGPRIHHAVDIPTTQRPTASGDSITLIDLDPSILMSLWGVTAAMVFPADDNTYRLFRRAYGTIDIADQLRPFVNFRLVRWVRPENIRLV